MDNSELPIKLDEALRAENYNDLKMADAKKIARDNFLGIIGCIPFVGAWVSAAVGSGISYSDMSLFRKIYAYIYEIKDTTQEERVKFFDQVEKKAKDASGHVICEMINRLDNVNKALVLANLTKAKINGEISVEEFFRLSSIAEKIPYTDFQYLPCFENKGYDDGGNTDTLYASGALILKTLDEDHNGYTLSASGRKLLKFGLNHDVKQEVKNATTIPSLGWYDADDTIDQGLDDQAMFDLDTQRGK